MGLAVLRCLDTRITAIGEQLRVGVAHFFVLKSTLSPFFHPYFCIFTPFGCTEDTYKYGKM